MPKRERTPSLEDLQDRRGVKRSRAAEASFKPIKIATAEAATAVDADPPFFKINQLMQLGIPDPGKGKVVFYWMRFADLRSVCHEFCHFPDPDSPMIS